MILFFRENNSKRDKFGGVLSLESPPPHENKNSIEVQSINNLDIK